MKVTPVIPIFKAGLWEIINPYQPIYTVRIVSKIFEKLLSKRLTNYLRSRKILMKYPYGFRENSNTEDAILEFIDHVYYSIHNPKGLFAAYIEFLKAFDTDNHIFSLRKLQHIGLRGKFLDWCKTYLTDRKKHLVSMVRFLCLELLIHAFLRDQICVH